MCYAADDERYNNGGAFKLTCRTAAGVVVTLLADNYYGYCKKEVKTQVSYAANLLGNAEEEHAGGAIAFASMSLGDQTRSNSVAVNGRTFADVVRDYGDGMDVRPEGYAVDKKWPDLIYLPEDAHATIASGRVRWTTGGVEQSIPLRPGKTYMTPSGFKVRMEKHPGAPELAADRHAGRGDVLPQAQHGVGRGQERDQQEHPRLHAVRADLRRRPGPGPGDDRRHLRPGLRRPVAGRPAAATEPADPQRRPVARQRH